MVDTSKITEHMPVIGSDGAHVGTVDHVRDDNIELTKNDPAAHGQHHLIPTSWIDHIDQHVHLNKSSEEVMMSWQVEQK